MNSTGRQGIPQGPPRVQSAALHRGADEILKLFFTSDKQGKLSSPKAVMTSAATQTDSSCNCSLNADIIDHLTQLLEEEKQKNARLMDELRSKDQILAQFQQAAPSPRADDTTITATSCDSTVQPTRLNMGEHSEVIVADFIAAECQDDEKMDCSTYTDISDDEKMDAEIEDILDLAMDYEDRFPYPKGVLPSQPLYKPDIREFIPSTSMKTFHIQCPASPVNDEERGVGFAIDESPPDSDSEQEIGK